jgi:DNA primase
MSEFLIINVLEEFLGEHRKHNEDTGQCSFDCPACSYEKDMPNGDGKGNLEINYNRGVFKCWSCQDTNNMSGPIKKLLNLYGTPRITRDYLLLKPDTYNYDNIKVKKVVSLPDGYKKLSDCTEKDYKSSQAIRYLNKRGITKEIIKDFEIGYTIKGDYFNRIIIPSFDIDGDLNYFVARWFDKNYTKIKYLNPEAEKQEIIFNEFKINVFSTIYIVEGVTDHIVTPNSIPLLGKVVSPILLDFLHENSMAYVVVFLDGDAWEDAKRIYSELNFGNLTGRVKIIKTPEDYDPSKINENFGSRGIIQTLKTARFLSDKEL